MSRCMLPATHHSEDVVEVHHGATATAVGCGFHAAYFLPELIAAHAAETSTL